MEFLQQISELVERFERYRQAYRSGSHNEPRLHHEFIDPFSEALCWDVNNKRGYAEVCKDVTHGDAIKVGGATKAQNYCFRIGETRKLLVETKKLSVSGEDAVHPAYQLRWYGPVRAVDRIAFRSRPLGADDVAYQREGQARVETGHASFWECCIHSLSQNRVTPARLITPDPQLRDGRV